MSKLGIATALTAIAILTYSVVVNGKPVEKEEVECTCDEQSREDCESKGESDCFYPEDCSTDSCVEEEEAKKKPAKKEKKS